MSHDKTDFTGPLTETNIKVKGLGGIEISSNVWQGPLEWNIEDDNGQVHTIKIPDAFYVPEGGCRLLSPQHWTQSAEDEGGTYCVTHGTATYLVWGNEEYVRTVPVDDHNVFTLQLAPGYHAFEVYCQEIQYHAFDDDINPSTLPIDDLICQPARAASVDHTDSPPPFPGEESQRESSPSPSPLPPNASTRVRFEEDQFDLNGPPVDSTNVPTTYETTQESARENATAELL